MELIKQLGGYEKAKSYVVDANACGAFDDENKIKSALLEYRRANNIFEVGDRVVKTNSKIKHAHIRVVISTSPSGGAVLDYQGFLYKHPCIRHATDAEIAAGHRL